MVLSDEYFEELEEGLDEAMSIANEARSRGGDPSTEVEIPVAEDLADRVENLLGVDGLAQRIRELEDDMSREDVALKLAVEFAEGSLGDYDTREGKVEGAIRTAVALLTEGVVAAPIEGIDGVHLLQNDDGTDYLRVDYAGPIRSAGGTAQALSVLIADYVRRQVGIEVYKPRDDEVERYVEEINLYDQETGLQYTPKDKETKKIIKNCPICLSGEPTSEREVSGFRDLERIDTNRARGGMCLVAAEGIALKAPKIKKHVTNLEMEGWGWLDDLIHDSSDSEGSEDDDSGDSSDSDESSDTEDSEDSEGGGDESEDEGDEGDEKEIKPNKKFLRDLTAGRPILSHASRPGGFRLRYGRSRNTGLAASGVNPATMAIFDDFLAPGTQIKTERPGKAQGVSPVDSIEGPTVKLRNGEVRRIDDVEEARRVRNGVEEILDVGEMSVNFGEFLENNHPLVPASYTYEWWIQELEETDADVSRLHDAFDLEDVTAKQAVKLSEKYGVPLHPEYTYLWHDIDLDEYEKLSRCVEEAEKIDESTDTDIPDTEDGGGYRLSNEVSDILEKLLVPHFQGDEGVEVGSNHFLIIERCTSYLDSGHEDSDQFSDVMTAVNESASFEVRRCAPVRIGARMGRPEKSKKREMRPAVHCLFPIGEAGGSQRDIDKATSHSESMRDAVGKIDVQLGQRECRDCAEITYKSRCECGGRTDPLKKCSVCDIEVEDGDECPRCGNTVSTVDNITVDIKSEYRDALESLGERDNYDILKCVKGLTSKNKTPEPLEKGVLRAKHDISVFKDGTIRYDMTDLPLTAFRPDELDVSVEKLRQLGYEEDIDGEPLTDESQVVEIKVQDVVLSDDSADYLLRVSNFLDDLLEEYYGLEPYYNAETREDLVGEYVMGMAPHTSAGVLGRVVGFTTASVGYAHPFFHAAKRRNCFHPDTELEVEINGEWQQTTIGDLVETHLVPESDGYDDTYDDGSIVQSIEDHPYIDSMRVPSMNDDEKRTIENVTHLSKHPAPKHMVRLELSNGRSLTVTSGHDFPVITENGPEKRKAHEIDIGDKLYDYGPDKVRETKDYKRIDILEHLLKGDHDISLDNVMVRGIERDSIYDIFESAIKPQWDGKFYKMKSSCEHLGINQKEFDNYLRRQSIPLTLFLELYDDKQEIIDKISDDVELGISRDNTTIPRIQILDEELSCFIGYYVAEGFCRTIEDTRVKRDIDGANQVDFAATERESRDFIKETLEHRFNVDNPYKSDKRYTASGKLLKYFFSDILEAGDECYTKRVPEQIMASCERVKLQFLSGYLSGDRGVEFGKRLTAFTASNELKETIEELLESIGIDAKYKKVEPQPVREKFPDYYDEDNERMSAAGYRINISSIDSEYISQEVGIHLSRKNKMGVENDTVVVQDVSYVEDSTDVVYDITVNRTHYFQASQCLMANCDGDEDCLMLLMDGLLNFSKEYLPDKRGGHMDAPLVMTSRIDPEEIDDEAHNVDKEKRYPLEFYEKTLEIADPKSIDCIDIAEDHLGGEGAYEGFDSNFNTTDIALGPENSAYKTLGSMLDKTEAQLEIARKLRAVDHADVAERVIESHFLPDLIGNLRAFSQQEVRCTSCNDKYRRPPLSGKCDCGGDLILTVHEGSVKKYLDVSLNVGEEYGISSYTMQRLEQLERQINSIFEDDKSRQSGIADFM